MAKNRQIRQIVRKSYAHGFVTPIVADTFAPGLSEEVIRQISARKDEPDFMLQWRLQAYRYWQALSPPGWAKLHYPAIDFQKIIYYSAPGDKSKKMPVRQKVWTKWILNC